MFPAPNLDLTFSKQQGKKQDGAREDATGVRTLTTPGKTADFGPALSRLSAVLICQATEVFIHQRGQTHHK